MSDDYVGEQENVRPAPRQLPAPVRGLPVVVTRGGVTGRVVHQDDCGRAML